MALLILFVAPTQNFFLKTIARDGEAAAAEETLARIPRR
jgi:hypothetical protein